MLPSSVFFAVLALAAVSAHPHVTAEEAVAHLKPRMAAPAFTAKSVSPAGDFEDVSLSDYAGKYVVLVFYPVSYRGWLHCLHELPSCVSRGM